MSLGRFVAHLHQAGITHSDLHPGNLLFRRTEDDEVVLYLIDLHAVHLGRPLHWSASRDNLIILNRWFSLRAADPIGCASGRAITRRAMVRSREGPTREGPS